MNQQERTLLVQFLDQLTAARAAHKDAEAEALIRETVARQPDAAYLLVQRALQLEQALKIAQAEAQHARDELARSRDSAGFLGDPNAWGRSPAATSPTGAPVASSSGQARAQNPAPVSPRAGSNLLGSVAATAAGVVAGSFLFQGVQNLLGRHGTDAPWDTGGGVEPQDAAALDERQDTASLDDDFDASTLDDGGGDFV